jgi:hypothetical protein
LLPKNNIRPNTNEDIIKSFMSAIS